MLDFGEDRVRQIASVVVGRVFVSGRAVMLARRAEIGNQNTEESRAYPSGSIREQREGRRGIQCARPRPQVDGICRHVLGPSSREDMILGWGPWRSVRGVRSHGVNAQASTMGADELEAECAAGEQQTISAND